MNSSVTLDKKISQYKLKNLEQVLATHDFSEETPLGEILNSLEDDAHE